MYVKNDANLLWQTLVREIYILMKHYKTKEALKDAFEAIKPTKVKPKARKEDKERCKVFTELESIEENPDDWNTILRYCQGSYINVLESGYIVNQPNELGKVFMMDFNKGVARFYKTDLNGKTRELNVATIEEIMNFEEMPTKSYVELVTEMNKHFAQFYEKYSKVQEEIDKINVIISKAKNQCSFNIEKKAKHLLDGMVWERKKLILERRVFYHRLKALDLIDESI